GVRAGGAADRGRRHRGRDTAVGPGFDRAGLIAMDLEALRTGPLEDVPDPAPLVSRETVFDGAVWDIVRDTVTFGGRPMTREYVAHTGAVVVAAIDDDDRVLLINQYRQPIGT